MSKVRYLRRIGHVALLIALVGLIAFPASSAPKSKSMALGSTAITHLSQSVAFRYWMANPDEAPAALRAVLSATSATAAHASSDEGTHGGFSNTTLFNLDDVGFPQNEESISVCRDNPRLVMGSTNDYRGLTGLLDPEGNGTGWHFSVDGGNSVAKEGFLPAVSVGGTAERPSGGDPVSAFDRDGDCNIYASSLNYDPVDPFANTNGVGIYKTDAETLLSPDCVGGGPADPDCWPTRRYAAFTDDPSHFLDKEWFDVGESGDAGEVVWVAYTDFFSFEPTPENPAGFTAEVLAVRCDADLVNCTDPIPISDDSSLGGGPDVDVQFADVTIGGDGRTYITWSQISGEIEGTPQTFVHKMRIAPAGSLEFGPEITIFSEGNAIPFGGFMHSNDFRVATYPKNAVRMIGGTPRIYLVWDACRFRLFDNVCEESEIKLTFSDDDGASWSSPLILSAGGDNYFPTISDDPLGKRLAVAYFTNRRDTQFHNRQDVELISVSPDGNVLKRNVLTRFSNESEADPLIGGLFIGDYIEVFAHKGVAWVHYNANYRQVQVLGEGFPVAQQDNFLARVRL